MKNKRLLILIFLLYFLPRVLNLGDILMVDEPTWISRSTNFIQGVLRFDFVKTLQSQTPQASHPGATTMWLGGVGYILNRLPSYLIQLPPTLQVFLYKLPVVLFSSLFFTWVVAILLSFLEPVFVILIAGFIALDPFLIAYTRLLHVDGLLTIFTFGSLVTLYYALSSRSKKYFLLSAIFSGLAIASKIPALSLIPFAFVLIYFSKLELNLGGKKTKNKFYVFGIWLLVLSLAFFIVWPVMWVDPFHALYSIVGASTKGALYEHQSQTYALHPRFYYDTLKLYTTPIVQALAAVGLFFVFLPHKYRKFVLTMLGFTLFFVVGMTLGAKKGERYVLPVFPLINILAAYGVYRIYLILKKKSRELATLTVILILGLTAFHSFSYHPYYITYFNPINKAPERLGIGEGLEQAADYLNKKPDAKKLTVAAWYDSSFAIYFKGKTVDVEYFGKKDVDYVVIYKNMYGRPKEHIATQVIEKFKNKKPEKIIHIQNIPFAWVYKK